MADTTFLSERLSSKIARFDFEKNISWQRRILLHLLMWMAFATLLFLSYRIAYGLTVFNSMILTVRMMLSNMLVFYLFFYIIVPWIFNQKLATALVILVLAAPLLVAAWLWTTYAFSLLYHHLGYEIESGELKGAITGSARQTLWGAVSPSRMISQSITIISLLSPYFFMKILFEISKLYANSMKMAAENAQLEIQNINIEKDFLKSQLNPHFLFNTLNNLYSLSLKKDDRMPDIILSLSDTMSYTLYESNAERVPLAKEIIFIENYIALEKMRCARQDKISVILPSEDNCKGKYIAPLLTFSLIENAFKYGLKNKENSFLNLEIKVIGHLFSFRIENDFLPKTETGTAGGIGLENLKKRLQLIYPGRHSLVMDTAKDIFSIQLQIEL